jgi:hypothetical protein
MRLIQPITKPCFKAIITNRQKKNHQGKDKGVELRHLKEFDKDIHNSNAGY